MTQYHIDFLEANRKIYEAMDRQEFAARSFNHSPFVEIMQTEFDPQIQPIMSGEAERQVKMIISLYERYDALKRQGLEITSDPKYAAPAPVRHFIESEPKPNWQR
jgi:hypothetical protein